MRDPETAIDQLAVVLDEMRQGDGETIPVTRSVENLVRLGGHLQSLFEAGTSYHTAKAGDTAHERNRAAGFIYDFFYRELDISRSSARAYMRCHRRFGGDDEAVKYFSFSELNLLSASHVTDDQIFEILEQKRNNLQMTRADVAKMLKALQANMNDCDRGEDSHG
ncbi:hypothetical protein R70199_08147 [Paraburkholderia domus]|nr:hypothetical protein R70199_08147 [Paraburkholderia domus]